MSRIGPNDSDIHDFRDPQMQRKIREGAELEMQRFRVGEQFPAQQVMADVHYRANWFGVRMNNEQRVCPCCLQRVKDTQFNLCSTNMDNSFLSSDIVLLFAFIRMLIYYFALRLVITDLFNLYTNYTGHNCAQVKECFPTLTQRLSIVNKLFELNELFIVDMLNFAFVGLSIIFFTSYDRYFYDWFIGMSVEIQTEDDFTLFVTNIPIIQPQDKHFEIHYAEGIESHINNIVNEWLMDPKKNYELYEDYMKTAITHRHSPQNPPKIVSGVNLCWDNYELTKIDDEKEELQKQYQEFKSSKKHDDDDDVIYDDRGTIEDLMTLNKASIELCQQFELNHYFGFVVSKFLGKAFVSFEYEHFSRLVYDRINKSAPFKNHKLKAVIAAPPRDVYWENLHVTTWQRIQKMIVTFFICAACLFIAFLILLGIKFYHRKAYEDNDSAPSTPGSYGITIVVSLFILLINFVLRYVIRKLANYEQHETKSKHDASIMYKTIISVIFNQIFNPIIVNVLLGNKLWAPHGLTRQITSLLYTSLVIQIIRSIFNPFHIWSWIKFKWNYRNAPPILKFQDNYNEEYALLGFYPYQKYTYYIDQLYLLAFYCYLVPMGSIIGIILFMVHYLIDKVMLLKYSSFHPSYSYTLTQISLILVENSVLVMAVGNYVIAGMFRNRWFQSINLISIVMALVYTILVWIQPLRKFFLREHTQYEKMSYSDCVKEAKFFHTYYSLNPATKLASNNRKNKQLIGVNEPIPVAGNKDRQTSKFLDMVIHGTVLQTSS